MCSQFTRSLKTLSFMPMGDRNLSAFEHTRGTQIAVGGLQVSHHCSKLLCYRTVLVVLNSLPIHVLFYVLFDLIRFLSADTVESRTVEISSTGNRNIREFKLPV
jgi:hypothetical protein